MMYTVLTVVAYQAIIRKVENMRKGYGEALLITAGEEGRVFFDVSLGGAPANLSGSSATLYIYPKGTNRAYSSEIMRSGHGLHVDPSGRIAAFFSQQLTTNLSVSAEAWYDWELWVKRPINNRIDKAGNGRLVVSQQ